MASAKVTLFRWAVRLMPALFWRDKAPRNLRVETRVLPVEGGSIRARVYTPLEGSAPFPVILYFHGGGWVVGSIDSQDPVCRDLCVRTGCMVVSVDYRLAPEYPFPAAVNDALASLEWLDAGCEALGGDRNRIMVAGDSAGGNLAAVVSIQCRDRHPGLLKGQILVYPVADHYSRAKKSYEENASGHGLTRDMMTWFFDLYLKGSPLLQAGQFQHDWLTPLTVRDLSNLPPALVITAGKDPLRDEGAGYAERLSQHGVAVQYSHYADQEHGFAGNMGPTEAYATVMTEISNWVKTR